VFDDFVFDDFVFDDFVFDDFVFVDPDVPVEVEWLSNRSILNND